ncbi:MAG: hypothetical protein BMS9Abin37_1577 [Acidobacteriota bacterium]|nr:MAG: hypothetical protein BMS9Abin37_1577 [Acidobacteriota bacterium]
MPVVKSLLYVLGLLFLHSQGAFPEPKLDPFFTPRPEFYEGLAPIAIGEPDESKSSPNLFRQIGLDFKHVFTRKESLVIVGVGLGAAGVASFFDDEIANSRFNSKKDAGRTSDEILDPGTVLGSFVVQVGGAFAAYGLGKLFSKPGLERLGRDLVRAQVVTQTLTFGVKVAVGRERPDGSNNKSFPSGHASGSFATATVLQRHYGFKVGIPAYVVAGYIAASRLSENKHYLSDVVFGAAVGILGGRTVTVGLENKQFAMGPMLVPGGIGVQFTWLGTSRKPR